MSADKRCEGIAAYRYTWPGKEEAVACADHAKQLRNIAEVMGSFLQIVPLSENDVELGLQCGSFIGEKP